MQKDNTLEQKTESLLCKNTQKRLQDYRKSF